MFVQGKPQLNKLLKADGAVYVRRSVFRNIHLNANTDEEENILRDLVRVLKEVGLLLVRT